MRYGEILEHQIDMKEVEIKFEISDVIETTKKLSEFSDCETLEYLDTYFDNKSEDMTKSDKEVRIREVQYSDGRIISILTAKTPPFESVDNNKKEYELVVYSVNDAENLLAVLGFFRTISFKKFCRNFQFEWRGQQVSATVTSLQDIERHFLEIESIIPDDEDDKLKRKLLESLAVNLGISLESRTNEYYTDIIAKCHNL